MQSKLMVLIERPDTIKQPRLHRKYIQLAQILYAIGIKEISIEVSTEINKEIERLNTIKDKDPLLIKEIAKAQQKILKLVLHTYKFVPINHYRNIWLAVGMAAFGIPLGILFGLGLHNMAFFSIGLPIGMVIGMAYGIQMDKKALKEEKQLAVEINA
ncbi:hypothetical protein DNU06_00880 [Putridiphycobacter roseus]|uniref:Uncharacterized protein n=1 Tax=Putridiphycobacter roseus TaxID=2219161 RepID=A0A2W1N4A1_9FLAO|nr:hypothetical protein [Putridiphycobacter roseus]PZE18420.1 hypothetical protein DNU06_00880 [Putridiphycobacter roseus]